MSRIAFPTASTPRPDLSIEEAEQILAQTLPCDVDYAADCSATANRAGSRITLTRTALVMIKPSHKLFMMCAGRPTLREAVEVALNGYAMAERATREARN